VTGVASEQGFDALIVVQDVTELSQRIREVREMRDRALHEVEQRTAAQRELAREREKAQVTLSSIGDAVLSVTPDCRIEYLNPAAERLLRRPAAECAGRPVDEVVRLLDPLTRSPARSSAREALARNELVRPELRGLLAGAEGEEVPVDQSASPIRGPDGQLQGAVLVLHDASAESRREGEQLRAKKLESLAQLAGGIAHEFNNVLTGVTTNVALILAAQPPSGGAATHATETVEMLQEVERAVARAKGLTLKLLTFATGGEPVRRLLPIGELVAAAAQSVPRPEGVGCRVEVVDDLWPAEVDPGLVAELVRGLVHNGVEALGGRGTVKVHLDNVRLLPSNAQRLPAGAYVRLAVHDGGAGIAPQLLERIFEPFFTTTQGSSGLGLSAARSIALKHGGHLAISSQVGSGTTAIVHLPASPEPAQETAPAPLPPPRAPSPTPPPPVRDTPPPATGAAPRGAGESRPGVEANLGTVLLMDDEEMIRRSASRLLSKLGYRVVAVSEGQSAVDQVRLARDSQRRFVAAILDLTVSPGMGGAEAAAQIHRLTPDLPLIVSSGYSSDPVMADFERYGFTAVLPKPYTIPELRAALGAVRPGAARQPSAPPSSR
jgi:PAS domain S-box-containing protein